MADLKYNFNEAVFTYLICPKRVSLFEEAVSFGDDCIVNRTKGTECLFSEHSATREKLCVIGFCVDSHAEISRRDIPSYFLKCSRQTVESIMDSCGRMVGRYIILYENDTGLYALPDATASMQINYLASGKHAALASCGRFLADLFRRQPSEKAIEIHRNSLYPHTMPGDLTLYEDIRVVLPNHFLDVRSGTVSRYFSPPGTLMSWGPQVPLAEVVRKTILCADRTTNEFAKHYHILCPLSGGRDSRLNLAFLQRNQALSEVFTFIHDTIHGHEDVLVAGKICNDLKIPHAQLPDLHAPQDYSEGVLRSLDLPEGGQELDQRNEHELIDLAYTLVSRFPGCVILTGDISDQIAKSCKYPAGLPTGKISLATDIITGTEKSFSKEARREIVRWIEGANAVSGAGMDIYDLYSLESQCGRWAAESFKVYCLCSISTLNLFNCRELIELWASVPKKLRRKKVIHQKILEQAAPQLLEYPFAPYSETRVQKGKNLLSEVLKAVNIRLYYKGKIMLGIIRIRKVHGADRKNSGDKYEYHYFTRRRSPLSFGPFPDGSRVPEALDPECDSAVQKKNHISCLSAPDAGDFRKEAKSD